MPASPSCRPTGSHDRRSVLHMCSSNTAGPGAGAAKYVALSVAPSGAAIVTSFGAGAAALNGVALNSRRSRPCLICAAIIRSPASSSRSEDLLHLDLELGLRHGPEDVNRQHRP